MSSADDGWAPTEAQAELIHADGSRLVEACPGAGKTRAIVERYRRVAAVEVRRGVGLLSFTNAAIDEVRQRCNDPSLLRSPNFVGTFDSFINRFIAGPSMATALGRAPRFVESWEAIRAAQFSPDTDSHALKFSLDHFEWTEDEEYRFDPSRTRGKFAAALRKAYEDNPKEIDDKAAALRTLLVNKHVIVPCAESRRIALKILRNPERSSGAAVVLRRFRELVVDEAQDCGYEELEILRFALSHGVDVVAVADPDQAIFEFRRAAPDELARFGDEVGRGTRLNGNFRSSPAIIDVGQRLRSSPQADGALGPEAQSSQGVILYGFDNPGDVTTIVRDHVAKAEFDGVVPVVLAHQSKVAAAGAGAVVDDMASKRVVLVFAEAAIVLRTLNDPARRRSALVAVERALLRSVGADAGLSIEDDLVALGLTPRWIRDAATRVVFGADPRAGDRSEYTAAVRTIVNALPWPEGIAPSNNVLSTPPAAGWSSLGITGSASLEALPWMTVHASKGREFDAVALLIPKSLWSDESGLTCIDHWEQGTDAESRRVLYVGATRAIKLLMIGVHVDHLDRVAALLE